MLLTPDGYLRPTGGSPVMTAREATSICPGIEISHEPDATVKYHRLWGPVISTCTGHSTDPEFRYSGSSGGAITALCFGLLETGAISFVWHTRADPEDPIGNVTGPSRSRGDLLKAAGSRYGPSSPLAGLADALATGKTFAFVGKPCDVAALRKLALMDPRIDRQIPYKLSFFCAGVPSRHGTMEVVRKLDTDLTDVKSFRYRGEGWPGVARVVRHDGSTSTMNYNSSWGTILNRHLQFRCKVCPDGTGEFADIACADAWYGSGGYPDFEEREGRSLIVSRTEVGERLLRRMEDSGYLAMVPLDIREIEAMQPYQANRKRNVPARSLALMLAGRLTPRFRRFGFVGLVLSHSWVDQFRNLIGTLRRVLGKRSS